MVPSNWLTLLGFFALVAPGVYYDLRRSTKFAERRETTFREVGRVVLVSTCCSAIALPIVLVVASGLRTWTKSDIWPTPRDLVLANHAYVGDHVIPIGLGLLVFVATSIGVSEATLRIASRNAEAKISHASTWSKSFRDDCPQGAHPVIRVRLTSGTSWSGRVAHFSPDLEVADRELVLAPPIAMKANGAPANLPKWGRVILRADQIESIAVRYEPDSPSDTG